MVKEGDGFWITEENGEFFMRSKALAVADILDKICFLQMKVE